jgi:hypothetical protein
MDLDALRAKLAETPAVRATGRVLGVTGLALRFVMPGVRVGDVVRVMRRGEALACEVVGFDEGEAVAMPLGSLAGVGPDDAVEATGGPLSVRASDGLLGRVVDGLGRPMDGRGPLGMGEEVLVDRDPPDALARRPVERPIATGVRVLDGLLTLGEGAARGPLCRERSGEIDAARRGRARRRSGRGRRGARRRARPRGRRVPRARARRGGPQKERRRRGDERRGGARAAARGAGGHGLRGALP